MSRFLVREGCDSPEGTGLGWVGDTAEHANRRGTTYEQYVRLAGEINDSDIPPERRIGKYSLILEDFNRSAKDTVIGGSFMVAASPGELHLLSAFMRKEYRGKHLGSFVIGRPLELAVTTLPVTKLFVHNIGQADPALVEKMYQKGFHSTDNESVLSLHLPGQHIFPRSQVDVHALDAEIAQKSWSGRYGNRIYRNGNLIGSTKRIGKWNDKLGLYDAKGGLLERWNIDDDVDVDWELSAAIWLLNSPSSKKLG